MSGFFVNSETEESHSSSITSDGHEFADAHAEGHEHSDFGIGTLALAMALGIVSRIYITHMTGLPYTVLLLCLGLAVGIFLHERVLGDLSRFGDSLERWADVSPEVILFVFLPILIFESAFNTDVHIFQREFWQVLTLAGPGVVLATGLTACVVKYIFPYGWGWDGSLMVGGMLSATDPVAVVALLKELGVSERLAVLIEGESLLNDATAIVVFIVFRDALVGANDSSPLSVIETAARMSLGGPVVGLVLGMLGSFSLGYIIDDALTEITLTVIVCFSAFMISEATELHVSGVLAVVTTGLVMSFYARGRISPGVEETMHTFWSTATYVANTVIFFVSGLIIADRALFDDHIKAREWGLLMLLYLMLQLIRIFVVVALLPVLTRGGYGMSHKQLLVLAFAGLRGAVVLTLGLIVVEDDRIDETQRALVLFYVAGIAALTLVVNGTLTGSLVHFLGLDRSTDAETEIFARACAAIEARLEHKLDLLKGDRFLGDADWELVWRYIPVSTSKSYWHRIRHGNINLSEAEEEEIHEHADNHSRQKGGGITGKIKFRGRQLRKWFTRRVLRLPGGVNYDDLPYRLRQTWYNYHKEYHMPVLASSKRDEVQHRKDMELARLNAEPRMIVEAEVWSNLNVRSADFAAPNRMPASSTLRNHLDNVGINGLADDVGMMSGLGQAEMTQQAAGGAPGFLLGRDSGSISYDPVASTRDLAHAASVRGIGQNLSANSVGFPTGWTTSADDQRKAVEGIKQLKEDRRRAAQAVAKAESRLTRLQKEMGLMKHKGEEAEMAESIMNTKTSVAQAALMVERGTRDDSDTVVKHHQNPYYAGKKLTSTSLHSHHSRVESGGYSFADLDDDDNEEEKERDGGVGSGRRGVTPNTGRRGSGGGGSTPGRPESTTSAAARNNQTLGSGSSHGLMTAARSVVVGSVGGEFRGHRKGFSGGSGIGTSFAGGGVGGDGDLGEDSTGKPASWGARRSGQVSIAAAVEAAGKRAAKNEVPAKSGVAPEWDPYEDGDGKDDPLDRSGRGTAMAGGVGGAGHAVMGPGAVTLDSMAEARVRFLTAVKAHCTERYRQGWLSSTGLRVLKENMDAQLDYEEKELEQWSHLKQAYTLPALSMASIRKIPVIGSLLEPYVYRRLTFIFELASNFISAHEDVDILELLNEGPVAYQLALEKNRQLQEARETLAKQLPVFPELARSMKTQVAARYMLVQHREVVHELFHHGHINEREFEHLVIQNNTARVRLAYHPHADQIPDRFDLLKNVPFLRFLSDEEKYAIIYDEKACKEEFYGSNVVLMQEKTSNAKTSKRAGWFNVVRGAVRQTTEGLLDHTSVGGTLRTRRLAKERLVNAGTVIGLDEQLLQAPYQCTYVTASFVHLFYFDKNQMMLLAEHYPGLKRGLWWLLAVSVVRHHRGFRRMNLMGVYQLMRSAQFRELRQDPSLQPDNGRMSRHTQSRHGWGRGSLPKIAPSSPGPPGSLNASRHARTPNRRGTLDDSRHRLVRAAASTLNESRHKLNESRHKLTKGLRRTVSRGNLAEGGDGGERIPPEIVKHRVVLEPGCQVLLLKGMMFSRDRSHPLGGVISKKAVTIIRDAVGPVDFSDGSVLFIMPAVLVARSTSSHQLLMAAVQARNEEKEAAALDEALALSSTTVSAVGAAGEQPATGPALKHKSSNLSASGTYAAHASPPSPSRQNLGPPAGGLIPMGDTGELLHAAESSLRNSIATDVVTIAAADEANPMAHPDIVRRKRTLRDAGLAAKAAPSAFSASADNSGVGGASGASGGGASRSRQNSAGSAGSDSGVNRPRQTTSTRLALQKSKNRHHDMFVEMMDMPVAHMDEDSPRSSRAPSALLYPESYVIDPVAHAQQVARRLEEDSLAREAAERSAGDGNAVQPAWAGAAEGAKTDAPAQGTVNPESHVPPPVEGSDSHV